MQFDAKHDIPACVEALQPSDFHKTMPSHKKPGLIQDVYLTTYCGRALYVKLQLSIKAIVISFHPDNS